MIGRFYHNPRCSKSRQALDLLRSRGVEPEVVEYLKTPPTEEELRELVRMLGAPPLRPDAEPGGEDPVAFMAAHPSALERPIFVRGGRAVVGRPPERVLELL